MYAETTLSVDYVISITCCYIWSWLCDLVCSSAGQQYLNFIHSMYYSSGKNILNLNIVDLLTNDT